MRRKALTCNNSAVCVAALGTMLKTYRPTALLRLENEKLPKAVARIRVYTAITLDSRVPVCFAQTSKGEISKLLLLLLLTHDDEVLAEGKSIDRRKIFSRNKL